MNKTNRRDHIIKFMKSETFFDSDSYHELKLADFYNTPKQTKTTYTFIKALNYLLNTKSCIYPMKKLLTLLIYIMVASAPLSAQLYLTPDTSLVELGGKAEVNIKVKNFKNLTGLQFSLNWNPAIMKYDTVKNFNLPGLSADMIGADPDTLAAGKIGLLWTSFQPLGNMMADGSTMLTFVFDVVGKKGESTTVKVEDSPVFAEAYDTAGVLVPVVKGTGKVTIKFPVNTNELWTEKDNIKLYNPDPNPFVNNTKITWEMPTAGNLSIIITDPSGKQVKKVDGNFGSGKNSIQLDQSDIPLPGSYFVTLKSNNTTLSRKLIKVN